jgi:hypothetical protein
MKTVLVCAALLAASGSASAACNLQEHMITGIVTTGTAPVANAVIEANWDEKQSGGASTRTKSQPDGRFTLTIVFDPYSGRSIGGDDRCDSKLTQVRVSARAAGGLDANERVVKMGGQLPPEITIELK